MRRLAVFRAFGRLLGRLWRWLRWMPQAPASEEVRDYDAELPRRYREIGARYLLVHPRSRKLLNIQQHAGYLSRHELQRWRVVLANTPHAVIPERGVHMKERGASI